ncbi:MAG: alkanonic acid methyltransferase, partial [Halobacteriales archaeon]
RVALLNATRSDRPLVRPLNLAFRGFVRAGAPGNRLARRSPARDLERKVQEAQDALAGRCEAFRRESLAGGYLSLAGGRVVG